MNIYIRANEIEKKQAEGQMKFYLLSSFFFVRKNEKELLN